MTDSEYKIVEPFIVRCVRRYGRGMNLEDCHSEAWRAYLEADADYHLVQNCCDKASYAEQKIEEHLGLMRRKRSERIKLESPFSLDTPYYDTGESAVDHFPRKSGDCFNYVALRDFIGRLEYEEMRIAWLLDFGLDEQEIMEERRIDAAQFYGLLRELRSDFLQWQLI